MPKGIYLLISSQKLHHGDFAEICIDNSLANFALHRGYLHKGNCPSGVQPLLKKISALDGDKVILTPNSITINGKELAHSKTLTYDKHERSLPSIQRGIYILLPHQMWLYGIDSERSWDSRYFGVINTSCVLSVAKPLISWTTR